MRRDDDPYYEDEPEFFCDACKDQGWLDFDDFVVPCTECSAPVTLADLEEHFYA